MTDCLPTEIGWLDHSRVPRTGSPSPVMNKPSVLAPVQLRMRNSLSEMTRMKGFTAGVGGPPETGCSTGAWETGRSGNSEAVSRSIML